MIFVGVLTFVMESEKNSLDNFSTHFVFSSVYLQIIGAAFIVIENGRYETLLLSKNI